MTKLPKVKIARSALHLSRMSFVQKVQFARAVVIAMTGNIHFPTPLPVLTQITSDANDLEVASNAAQTHAKGMHAIEVAKSKALQLSLQLLAHYVEGVANGDPNNAESIILSAGMQIKKQTNPGPRILSAKSNNKGEVTLTNPAVRSASYRWEIATLDPTIDANWKFFTEDKKSKIVRTGLANSTMYHFRVYTLTKTGTSTASQVITVTVQ
jgi:hypothetical protein